MECSPLLENIQVCIFNVSVMIYDKPRIAITEVAECKVTIIYLVNYLAGR